METLDKFDLAILNELQNDGRLTNAELASRVGLSAAPVAWEAHMGGFLVGLLGFDLFDPKRTIGPPQ